jgi:curved DNA-binding protein CbpA
MDLYQILEIETSASEAEIKKAYLRMVKIHHPDKHSDDMKEEATKKFQKIHSAYEILSNNKTRVEYMKMNSTDRYTFVDILEKFISNNINIDEFKRYGLKIDRFDIDYIQKNFMNFIKSIDVSELLNLFTRGNVKKKKFDNIINCSESELDIFDETIAEYYYNIPIYLQRNNKLDIKIELPIKLGDITNNNKRKIKIKRSINNKLEESVFIFKLNMPNIIFIGGGDMKNDDCGNLIIRLILPNNLLWNEDIILIEQSMSLYELIYGISINLDIGDGKSINIDDWVPSRDGLLINIDNTINNIKDINLGIKLFLDYEDTSERKELLKTYFC